jgi:hypothetical protein
MIVLATTGTRIPEVCRHTSKVLQVKGLQSPPARAWAESMSQSDATKEYIAVVAVYSEKLADELRYLGEPYRVVVAECDKESDAVNDSYGVVTVLPGATCLADWLDISPTNREPDHRGLTCGVFFNRHQWKWYGSVQRGVALFGGSCVPDDTRSESVRFCERCGRLEVIGNTYVDYDSWTWYRNVTISPAHRRLVGRRQFHEQLGLT